MSIQNMPCKLATTLDVNELEKDLKTSSQTGLTGSEAAKRIQQVGRNELRQKEEDPVYIKYLNQFKQPLVLMLLASAAISVVIGQWDDAISITLAIVIVCTVAFIQEYRSEQALEALTKLVKHKCKVIRDGVLQEMESSELVPGDLVSFTIGDRIPADVRIIKATDLSISEAELTGESVAVEKVAEKLSLQTTSVDEEDSKEIKERLNIGFMGTLIHGGNGRGIVIATGDATEIGIIAQKLNEVEDKKTPLQASMDDLGEKLSWMSISVIAIIFLLGVWNGHKWFNMFVLGVSMAVAAIPEGLPIVTTVTLAMGVMRMANRNAIVKKLPSVETLGCTNIVCTDKTGTLTMNQMTVKKIWTVKEKSIVSVSGLALDVQGEFSRNGKVLDLNKEPNVVKVLEIGLLCNNAQIMDSKLFGDATEGSLIVAASKAGMGDKFKENFVKKEEIAFSSKTKWMGTKYDNKKTSETHYYVKGALEAVLPKCNTWFADGDFKPLDDDLIDEIQKTAHQIASEGMRVLAFGFGKDHNKLALVGLVGILDPPRANVKDAIKNLREHGVRTIMITGDAKQTAIAIGKDLGIWTNDYNVALCPSDITEDMSKADLSRVSIFYRMTPSHKMIIVESLQKQGNIVAMLGDGVNDAVALKLADIGVAMGSGTDVCKEASKMVLVDDNFATINAAIEEGKSIFSGIKNFLRFQLTTSISALSMITFSNLLGYPPPINPMQILFINIIMDGPPAQCLGIEPVDSDIVHQPPRNPKDSVVTRQIITSVALNSLIMIIGTLWIYIREMSHDLVLSKRDTTMVFATFVCFQFFNALNCRSEKKSLFKIGLFSNRPLFIAIFLCYLGMLGVIYVPFLKIVFETDSLSLGDLILTTMIASSVLVFEEVLKFTKLNQ